MCADLFLPFFFHRVAMYDAELFLVDTVDLAQVPVLAKGFQMNSSKRDFVCMFVGQVCLHICIFPIEGSSMFQH